ncbi:MAG: hypothetical protein ACK4MQ_08515 [Hyphomonas sp.]
MAAASAAAITGVCAVASAQVVPLEIEGPVSAYEATTPETGILTIMGQLVHVYENTEFVTPTSDRSQTQRPNNPNRPLTANQWLRGERFEGRRRPGFLGGTLIVTGFWDPLMNAGAGGIYAEEVFSDISENVILGVITANSCATPACNGPDDFIEGNGSTKFVDNKDQRLPAQPIVDAGLFELNLTGANLVGTTFGGEGYYSDDPVYPRSAPAEQALVYWDFELGDLRPDLLLRRDQREVSVLRVRCTVGDRLEVRGWVHQAMNAQGVGPNANVGTMRITMRPPGATIVQVSEADFVLEINPAYARYQVRADVPNCAEEVEVDWMINGISVASTTAPVDRLRD